MPLVYPLAWPKGSDGRDIRPSQVDVHLASASRTGGQSATGIEQVVASPAARWEARIVFPPMDTATLLSFRGFVAAMAGRVGSVLMPAFERGRQPWPSDVFGRLKTPSDAAEPQLAGTPFAFDTPRAPVISVAAFAAAANATALTLSDVAVKGTVVGAIKSGHRFSIGPSLYEIQQAAVDPATGRIAVDIRPWLRADIADGAACEFVAPVCSMRFRTDDEGKLDLEANRFAQPELNLVEAF